ncbi:hypothetical protein HF086_014687 [Spodoptera exigua]|uniref:DDRGK domain-containing protein 1 n=1 Tax=Spodoptera exigua TaxID=7107 RepID=A0A922M837_SPOEX|nr:hypothetical protein HF086_014687 [Spodoptera exigua]
MDPFIIAAIISAIVIVLLSIAFLRVGSQIKPQGGARPRAVVQRDGGPGRVQAVRNQRARMRANAARHQAAALEEEPDVVDEVEEDNPTETQKVEFDDKMGAKKRAKLEAKMEKKKAREAEEQMREIKKKKDEELEQERKRLKKNRRITELQSSGELTGVIDDRGKFIYISQKELEDVAKFIRQRGRVSITDLAESSNDLINLNPVTVP